MRKIAVYTFLDYFKEAAINWIRGLQKDVTAKPTAFLTAALLGGEWLVNTQTSSFRSCFENSDAPF
jgi:hypothetical protein